MGRNESLKILTEKRPLSDPPSAIHTGLRNGVNVNKNRGLGFIRGVPHSVIPYYKSFDFFSLLNIVTDCVRCVSVPLPPPVDHRLIQIVLLTILLPVPNPSTSLHTGRNVHHRILNHRSSPRSEGDIVLIFGTKSFPGHCSVSRLIRSELIRDKPDRSHRTKLRPKVEGSPLPPVKSQEFLMKFCRLSPSFRDGQKVNNLPGQ